MLPTFRHCRNVQFALRVHSATERACLLPWDFVLRAITVLQVRLPYRRCAQLGSTVLSPLPHPLTARQGRILIPQAWRRQRSVFLVQMVVHVLFPVCVHPIQLVKLVIIVRLLLSPPRQRYARRGITAPHNQNFLWVVLVATIKIRLDR